MTFTVQTKKAYKRILVAVCALMMMIFLLSHDKGFADAGQNPPSKKAVIAAEDVTAVPVYSQSDTSSKKLGTLGNGESITVQSIKRDWAVISYHSQTAYIALNVIRFYKDFTFNEAKSIVDSAIAVQRKTWENNYTKAQIKDMLAPRFTQDYTERYFKQLFRQAGQTSNGTPLYHIIETEIYGYAIDSFDWEGKNDPQKPSVSYYIQDGVEYLKVSQYHLNEESGDHMSTLYLSKQPGDTNWKVYDYITVY